jgi:hypothetical protein
MKNANKSMKQSKKEYCNLYVNNSEMWHQKMWHLELIYYPNLHFANLWKYASCHLCICLFIWKFYIVKIVGCRFGAQIQVPRAYFLQFVFHKIDNVEFPFIFDKTKHLDNNNFNQFNVFWKLMVENAKHINFLPKACNSVKLLVFLHNGLRIMKHITRLNYLLSCIMAFTL